MDWTVENAAARAAEVAAWKNGIGEGYDPSTVLLGVKSGSLPGGITLMRLMVCDASSNILRAVFKRSRELLPPGGGKGRLNDGPGRVTEKTSPRLKPTLGGLGVPAWFCRGILTRGGGFPLEGGARWTKWTTFPFNSINDIRSFQNDWVTSILNSCSYHNLSTSCHPAGLVHSK